MAIQRLRMLQQKSSAIAKQQRRAMAELLAEGKLESARIRVENIIRSDITTELHEILELYCELLLARIQLLEQPSSSTAAMLAGEGAGGGGGGVSGVGELDSGLEEAVRSIVFSAPRTEIKELQQSRVLLVEKFGKEFALECVEGKGVPERVLKRLRVETPRRELVDAYLREIGRTYAVRFPGDPEPEDDEAENVHDRPNEGEDDADDDDDQPGSGGKAIQSLESPLRAEELSRATPPRDFGDSRPLRIAPPSPSTENVAPKLKLPGVDKGTVRAAATTPRKASVGAAPKPKPKEKSVEGAGGPGGKIPDVDELAKRFAALKKS
jgi:vacuolar protein sorting-associated protein IST1